MAAVSPRGLAFAAGRQAGIEARELIEPGAGTGWRSGRSAWDHSSLVRVLELMAHHEIGQLEGSELLG